MTDRSLRPGATRRRRYFRRVCLFIAVLVLTASCTPPGLPAPITPSSSAGDPGPSPRDDQMLVIGVDGAITGFNPYVSGQYSLAGQSVANLVLPSVFPPGAIGQNASSTALVDKVEVTSLAPFTVTYTLNKNAAWSDGTPIAAEDFTYLWQQMTSQPGLADTGGYRLISDIESADAGKTVIVEFAVEYADWRSLFSPLLPARTLKDLPGGFSGALLDGIPVSGSFYKLKSFDSINGEILLSRNDKYWGTEPGPVEVMIRIGSAAELAEAIQRGDIDAAYLQPEPATWARLQVENPASRQLTVPLPVADQIDFSLTGQLTANLAIRRGISLSLDLGALGGAWSGGRPGGFSRMLSMLTLPAAAAPADETIPLAGSAAAAFADAGFTRSGLYYSRQDQILQVVAGYSIDDPRARAAAAELQAQLGRAGVLVDLVGLSTADLIDPEAAPTRPDLVLRSSPRGPSDSALAVAAFDCRIPALDSEPAPFCPASADQLTPSVDTQMFDLLSDKQVEAQKSALDDLLWKRLYSLPVAEPNAVFVFGDKISRLAVGVDPARMLWGGPLADLPTWAATR